MPSNEATPFTIRDQLERDMKRALEGAIKTLLMQYRPHLPFDDRLHISRCANNRVGNLTVRVRIEIAGSDVEATWLEERG